MARTTLRRILLASTIMAGALAASTPSFAQTTPAPPTAADDADTIVVTGSILKQKVTASPVSVVSAADIDSRGLTTTQGAIQGLSANNGPALTNSFSANGAFAGGASAVSLRGLSTNSTLVLFDGLRAAYYPLADDGSRNFVDLNTIPDDIVDRIEILRDGASASYGADAIAGVVNVITKRQFKGIGARAEAGISERGLAANQRLSLTAGTGDLTANGFNAYVSLFYLREDQVNNRDLPAPFNSSDQRGLSFDGNRGPNNVIGGLDIDGNYPGFPSVPPYNSDIFVAPVEAGTTDLAGRFQLLNPATGCRRGNRYVLTAADLANDPNAPLVACQEDSINQDGVVTPKIIRFGGSARVTADIGGSSEAYLAINFQQSRVGYTVGPAQFVANAPTGILFPRFSTRNTGGAFAPGSAVLELPVFVCAARVNCNAVNGRLNPNNPFAAAGQTAQIRGLLIDSPTAQATRSRVYRFAAGIKGEALGGDYSVAVTGSHNDLQRSYTGYVFIQRLLDVVADGTYNFVNPGLNSAATNRFISPDNIVNATSDLYEANVTYSRALVTLPGGPLQLGVGASIRYEAIDSPSANPDTNGPTQRYFSLNAFGTSGNRTVYSGFGELNAPIFDALTLSAAARYDKYSSGQSAFSPKAGIKFQPFRQLTLRGTYSRGFRIPSFGEANALPTTGFVPASLATIPQSFLSQYGANCRGDNPNGCPTYITQATYGLTTLASPNLAPEKSRSFTGGVLFEPLPNVRFSVDYYNIKKSGAITNASTAPAIAAYYAGTPIPAGFTVIADTRDPNNPGARPRIAFVQAPLINSFSQKSEGLDFSADARFNLGADLKFSTRLEASYIIELSDIFDDGTKQTYAGTLGNFNLTAGSGTPRWHGNWQNTLEYRGLSLSATANYFGGYNLSAEDQTGPGTAGQGGLSSGFTPPDVRRYITVDLVGNVKVTPQFSFYVNVVNLLDALPPVDPVTYGAYLYNAVQGGTGVLGRQFRAGAKVNF
jgi:iron complex outermembrane recepter protein